MKKKQNKEGIQRYQQKKKEEGSIPYRDCSCLLKKNSFIFFIVLTKEKIQKTYEQKKIVRGIF